MAEPLTGESTASACFLVSPEDISIYPDQLAARTEEPSARADLGVATGYHSTQTSGFRQETPATCIAGAREILDVSGIRDAWAVDSGVASWLETLADEDDQNIEKRILLEQREPAATFNTNATRR